jgi:hypothetical protein
MYCLYCLPNLLQTELADSGLYGSVVNGTFFNLVAVDSGRFFSIGTL